MKPKKTTIVYGLRAILLLALSMTAGNINSQVYGEYGYAVSGFNLTSGNIGINNVTQPGVIMAGVRSGATGNDIIITRTDKGGQYNSQSWEFTKQYQIKYNNSCASPAFLATTVYGVSVIETNGSSGSPNMRYVMTGAFDNAAQSTGGVFVVELGASGNVITTFFWKVNTAAGTRTTKPVICESTVNPGEFYIAGSFANVMYIFDYKSGSTSLVSSMRWPNSTARPRAIIMSPYGNQDVTIVGDEIANATGQDGFFLQVKNTNVSAVNVYNHYDYNGGGGFVDQTFNSIAVANEATYGGNGFVIGGFNNDMSFSGHSWVLKVDPTGNQPAGYWSNLLSSGADPNSLTAVAVLERLNSLSNYEYYALLRSNSNLIVDKLDASGTPLGTSDDFDYNSIGSNAEGVAMSMDANPGDPDEGLQIYARDRTASVANLYYAESCFSGNSGCNTPGNSNPDMAAAPTIIAFTGPAPGSVSGCFGNGNGFTLGIGNSNLSPSPCGSAPYNGTGAAGGNNNRVNAATGLTHLATDKSSLQVYPNPTTNKISISLTANKSDRVQVELFDYLGRWVAAIPVSVSQNSASQTAEFDLGSLRLESGIYVVSANINGATTKQKIVYNK